MALAATNTTELRMLLETSWMVDLVSAIKL